MPAEPLDEEALFHAARRIADGEARELFIQQACGDDAALAERVRALLAMHEQEPGSAEAPPRQTVDYEPIAERPGSRIGPYKLMEQIGEGGMGEVWVAEQNEPVRRRVALKLIKAGMDSKSVLARFEAERQALALMDHPNIARVLDAGRTVEGRPFFVMEYVKGVPITQYCDDARLTVAERLALFVPVCQAVQHAHQKGIIHRDLKPSNILVCLYDGQPVAKVIDFGLAKALHQPLSEQTLYTAHGVMLGTPLYMSPEQAEFNNLDIDTRADIYSLGVILYELLTGTTPLEKQRFKDAAWQEMLRLIKEEEPPKPSTRLSSSGSLPSVATQRQLEPVKLTRLVRGELDWIVMKALAKERSRRYDTATGLARDVQRYLSDEPVEAGPPSMTYRLRKFVRRNRNVVVAASLVFLALVAGIIGTTWGLIRAEDAWQAEAQRAEGERLAKLEAQEARQKEADRAEGERLAKLDAQRLANHVIKANEILEQIFRDLQPRAEEKGGPPLRAQLGDRLEEAAKLLEGEVAGEPLRLARLQHRLGETLMSLGYDHRAIPVLEKARQTFEQHSGPDDFWTLSTTSSLAGVYQHTGRLREALALFEQTLARLQEKYPNDISTLVVMNNLAMAYQADNQSDKAIHLFEQALLKWRQRPGPEHIEMLACMDNLAQTYQRAGQPERALPLHEEVLAKFREKWGPDHFDTLICMIMLGEAYQALGQFDKAMPLYQEAMAKLKQSVGPEHGNTLWAMHNLGVLHYVANRPEQAIPLLQEVVMLRTKRLSAEHRHTLQTQMMLGGACLEAREFDKALPLLEQAFTKLKEIYGPEDPDTLRCMRHLASAYWGKKQFERSLALFEDLLPKARRIHGKHHPDTARAVAWFAMCLREVGRFADAANIADEFLAIYPKLSPANCASFDWFIPRAAQIFFNTNQFQKALPLFEQTLAKYREKHGPDHPKTLEILSNLAATYQGVGQPEKALPILTETLEKQKKLLGPDDEATLATMNNLASVYWGLKQVEHSVPLFEELVPKSRQKFGDDNPRTLTAVANLAVNYRDANRLAEAAKVTDEFMALYRKLPPQNQQQVARFLPEAAGIFDAAGQRAKSEPIYRDAVEELRKQFGDGHPRLASALFKLGFNLMKQSKWTEAEPVLRECLAISMKHEPDAWGTFATQSYLGHALLGQKNYADAEPLLVQGYEGMKKRQASVPPQTRAILTQGLTWLVELYDAWGKPDEAAKWRKELEAAKP